MPGRGSRRGEPAAPPDPAGAMDMAVRFLGARPRTRWEVERRLARAGADPSIIAATVEQLADSGYLDDLAFARWWGEQRDRHAPRGRRMLEAELRRAGVPAAVIEAYRREHDAPERAFEDEELPGTEAERARAVLIRHLRGRPLPDEPKARQRIGMYLVRRGFDPETVRGALRAAGAQAEDEAEEEG